MQAVCVQVSIGGLILLIAEQGIVIFSGCRPLPYEHRACLLHREGNRIKLGIVPMDRWLRKGLYL